MTLMNQDSIGHEGLQATLPATKSVNNMPKGIGTNYGHVGLLGVEGGGVEADEPVSITLEELVAR